MKGTRCCARAVASLLAVAALFSFASCSSSKKGFSTTDETASQWDSTVEKNVRDPERAAKLKQLGHQIVDLQRSMAGEVEAFEGQAFALYANYEATAEQRRQLVDDWVEKRKPRWAQYRDIVLAMRREATAEEWRALTK